MDQFGSHSPAELLCRTPPPNMAALVDPDQRKGVSFGDEVAGHVRETPKTSEDSEGARVSQ